MSTHGRGRGRGRGRIGTVTPGSAGNDPVDFMAALGNMAAAMQATADALGNKINQGNHGNNNDEDGPMTLATFLKVHPPTFRRTSNSTDADNWIQAMERALQAQQPGGAVIPWEVFRTEFYKKYFPNSDKNAKELELMQLKQGQMTVTEYTSRVFSELVNKSRVAEDYLRKATSDKGDQRVFVRKDQGRNFAPRGQDFKRGGYTPQLYLGQNNFQRFSNNNSQGKGKGKQAQTPPNDLTCRRCGKYHPNTPCRAGLGVCYYCGEAGHLSWNCPEKKKNQEAGKAQHQ
ncbi:uncharacterized protein LOC130956648 [Arachis stenosperma]|uniref:uncharacterized protein LOC130956648 n=1 Tax=Arachis stenosperma TaxID=217475 RepID=UPI0025AC1D66|nr:uncharacterized protein LOC130956648 [Arachis stenosperma]